MTRREVLDAKLGDEARQIQPRRFEIVLRCVARRPSSDDVARFSHPTQRGGTQFPLLPPAAPRALAHASAPRDPSQETARARKRMEQRPRAEERVQDPRGHPRRRPHPPGQLQARPGRRRRCGVAIPRDPGAATARVAPASHAPKGGHARAQGNRTRRRRADLLPRPPRPARARRRSRERERRRRRGHNGDASNAAGGARSQSASTDTGSRGGGSASTPATPSTGARPGALLRPPSGIDVAPCGHARPMTVRRPSAAGRPSLVPYALTPTDEEGVAAPPVPAAPRRRRSPTRPRRARWAAKRRSAATTTGLALA